MGAGLIKRFFGVCVLSRHLNAHGSIVGAVIDRDVTCQEENWLKWFLFLAMIFSKTKVQRHAIFVIEATWYYRYKLNFEVNLHVEFPHIYARIIRDKRELLWLISRLICKNCHFICGKWLTYEIISILIVAANFQLLRGNESDWIHKFLANLENLSKQSQDGNVVTRVRFIK